MKTLKLVTNRSGLQEEATLDKDSNLWARTDGQNVLQVSNKLLNFNNTQFFLQKLFSDVPDSEIVLKSEALLFVNILTHCCSISMHFG
jgi:hypothetical protein